MVIKTPESAPENEGVKTIADQAKQVISVLEGLEGKAGRIAESSQILEIFSLFPQHPDYNEFSTMQKLYPDVTEKILAMDISSEVYQEILNQLENSEKDCWRGLKKCWRKIVDHPILDALQLIDIDGDKGFDDDDKALLRAALLDEKEK